MTEEELRGKIADLLRSKYGDLIYYDEDSKDFITLIKEAGYKNCNQCDATNVKKEGPPMDEPLEAP